MLGKRARSVESPVDSLHTPTPKKQKQEQEQEQEQTTRPHTPTTSPLPNSSPDAAVPYQHLPLTRENLARLECDTPPPSMPPSSASDGGSSVVDGSARLEAYGIHVNSATPQPPLLAAHIKHVVKRTRDGPCSPAAKTISRKQPRAAGGNENTGLGILSPHLLFHGEADGGERYIHHITECILNRDYLPADAFAKTQVGALSQPRPDSAVGYIPAKVAAESITEDGNQSAAPLSRDEETVLMRAPLVSGLHFPFLTCQWKSAKGSQGHYHAELQSARDGAAIVNYLHTFFTDAGLTPSVVDVSHWSLTCDMQTVILHVHWRDDSMDPPTHHMQKVHQTFLKDLDDDDNPGVARLRAHLRNILDYAVGPRLASIKAAIPKLKVALSYKRARGSPTRKQSNLSVKSSAASDPGYGGSLSDAMVAVPSLPPPSIDDKSPDSKRRKV